MASTFKGLPIALNLPQFENHEKQEGKYTTCYMCACRCGIKVTVEDNEVRFIQGNKNHPVNKGVLCAKGNAGIMKQKSPAKLQQPMMRKKGSERGTGEFEPVSWDVALDYLSERLEKIRNTDPKKLAFFTGRDQMQALSGLWAQQYGTINWAAHGGFCSVNMAAAGLYSIGHAFWEFGDPDWDNTKYFMLWGVAEDHASNPIKIGLEKIKRRGAKFVSINPVRTGYQAIADEWVPIKPGTDAILALSMIHVLMKNDLFDWEYLIRYTNSPYLVYNTPGESTDGLICRDAEGNPQSWDLEKEALVDGSLPEIKPALFGEYTSADGKALKTVFTLLAERYLDDQYSPAEASKVCGVAADDIERMALEMAHVAFEETIEINCEWTDWAGRKHDKFIGRPVSMHAMRGISAHSNGFQACRAIHLLQIMLGSVDVPGGHLAKPPFPKHIVPPIKPAKPTSPGQPLNSPPLGFPTCPEDLVIDDDGKPLRIDKAYSWDAPIANHGLMHMVITNAVKGDPYPIDTLIIFMANMSWNSTMNTSSVRDMLTEKDESGEKDENGDYKYKLPFLVVADAFHSEMTAFADLILPDTTYLERYDTISILDRPISEPHAVCDAIRAPVIEPDRDVRPWQEVLVDLATRLKFPAFTKEDGSPKYEGYNDFVINYEKAPGLGFLAGWRGEDGSKSLRGEPNQNQWQDYIDNECFFEHKLPKEHHYYRFANKGYLEFAKESGFIGSSKPIIMELYSESLQKFRLAGQGLYDGPQPKNDYDKHRMVTYFDPLPDYYEPLEQQATSSTEYPFFAITQRPMMMYHSWDSQNAWLRQILAQNYMYMNRKKAEEMGIVDLSWIWVESENGKIRVQVKLMEGVESNTIWTWNAIGKQRGAWGLDPTANESNDGFLLNHLISEHLPSKSADRAVTNSDPITGQAAWYDLQVKIYPAAAGETGTWPTFDTIKPMPGAEKPVSKLQYQTHKAVGLHRSMRDILTRGKTKRDDS